VAAVMVVVVVVVHSAKNLLDQTKTHLLKDGSALAVQDSVVHLLGETCGVSERWCDTVSV
jgi:hypothetical protein